MPAYSLFGKKKQGFSSSKEYFNFILNLELAKIEAERQNASARSEKIQKENAG